MVHKLRETTSSEPQLLEELTMKTKSRYWDRRNLLRFCFYKGATCCKVLVLNLYYCQPASFLIPAIRSHKTITFFLNINSCIRVKNHVWSCCQISVLGYSQLCVLHFIFSSICSKVVGYKRPNDNPTFLLLSTYTISSKGLFTFLHAIT